MAKVRLTALYGRYSSHNQDDGFSIEYQRSETNDYAERNGIYIDVEYIDEAKTGTKVAGREKFYELIRAAKEGKIDTIIVYKLNRMFRNSSESQYYRDLFRKHGVKLVSATEHVDEETSSGRMTTNILSVIDQYQSEIISDHVKSSMREMARQGYHTGGNPAFGYGLQAIPHGKKIRRKLTPEPSEAAIVKMIFEMYVSGWRVNWVRDFLNENGYRTRKGKLFSPQTLRKILKNDVYIGTIRFHAKGYDEICVEDAHDEIVSKDLFFMAQEKFAEYADEKHGQKRKHFYPLSGLVYCACGSKCFGQTLKSRAKNTDYFYSMYKCTSKHNYRGCNLKHILSEELEKTVLQQIKLHILSEENIEQLAQHIADLTKSVPNETKNKIKQMKARAEEVNKRIDLLIEMRLNGELSGDIITQRSSPLETELKQLEKNIFLLQEQTKNAITVDSIKTYLNFMLQRSQKADTETLKVLFDNFVEKIIISNDLVELHFRVLPNQTFLHKGKSGVPAFTLCKKVER